MFFFFKQKTAYELRISDWSSDVCSSDLAVLLLVEDGVEGGALDRRDPARLHPRGGGQGRDDDVDHPLGAVETAPEIIVLTIGAAEEGAEAVELDALARKSVVLGKGVLVRVDLGRRRIIKTITHKKH